MKPQLDFLCDFFLLSLGSPPQDAISSTSLCQITPQWLSNMEDMLFHDRLGSVMGLRLLDRSRYDCLKPNCFRWPKLILTKTYGPAFIAISSEAVISKCWSGFFFPFLCVKRRAWSKNFSWKASYLSRTAFSIRFWLIVSTSRSGCFNDKYLNSSLLDKLMTWLGCCVRVNTDNVYY